MDLEAIFGKFGKAGAFAKASVPPSVTSAQKAALNRRGNELFNSGDFEGARRIFEATGYSDGLSRVGDHYRSLGRPVDALRMYWKAPDRVKSEPLLAGLAEIVRTLIREGEGPDDE